MSDYEYTRLYSAKFNTYFVLYLNQDQLENIRRKVRNSFPDAEIFADIKLLFLKALQYYYYRNDREFLTVDESEIRFYLKTRCKEISFKSETAEKLFQSFNINERGAMYYIRTNLADDAFFADICSLLELKSKNEMDVLYTDLLEYSLNSDNKFITPRDYFERYLLSQSEQDNGADHLMKKGLLVKLTRALCLCAEHNSDEWLTNGKTGFFLHNFLKSFEKGINTYTDDEIIQIYSNSLVMAETDKDFILDQLSRLIQDIQSKLDEAADNGQTPGLFLTRSKEIAKSIIGGIEGYINNCDSTFSPVEFGLECFSNIELIVDENCESYEKEADDLEKENKENKYDYDRIDENKISKQGLKVPLRIKKVITDIKGNGPTVQKDLEIFRRTKGMKNEGVTSDKNPYLYIIYLIAADRTELILDQTKRGESLRKALREFLYDCCFALKHKRDIEALNYYKDQINIIIKDRSDVTELNSQLSAYTSERFDKEKRNKFIAKISNSVKPCDIDIKKMIDILKKYEDAVEVKRLTDQLIKLAFEQPAVNYRSIEELVYYRGLELNKCMREVKQGIYKSVRKGHGSKKEKETVIGNNMTVFYKDMYSMSTVQYEGNISEMIKSLKAQGYETTRPFWTDIRKTANAIFNYLINYDIVHLMNSTDDSAINKEIDIYLSKISADSKAYRELSETASNHGYVDVHRILSVQQQAVSYNLLENSVIKQRFSNLTYAVLHPKFIDRVIDNLDAYTDMKLDDLGFKPPLVSRSAMIKAFTVYEIITGCSDLNEYISVLNSILELSNFAELNEKSAIDCYMIAIAYFQFNVGYVADIKKANIFCKNLLDKLLPADKSLPEDPKAMFDEGRLYLSEISYNKDTSKLICADKSEIWNNNIRKISLRDASNMFIPYYGAVIEAKSKRKYIFVFVYQINTEDDKTTNKDLSESKYDIIVFDCQTEKQSRSTVHASTASAESGIKCLSILFEDFLKAVYPVAPFKENLKRISYSLLTFHSCYISNVRKEDYVLCIFAIAHSNDGNRQIVGGWTFAKDIIEYKEWINILTSIKEKGIEGMRYVCSDIPNGFEKALKKIYPGAIAQSHMIQLISNRTLKVFSTSNARQKFDSSNKVRNVTVWLYKQSEEKLSSKETREKLGELRRLIAESERYRSKTKESEVLIKTMVETLDNKPDFKRRETDFKETLKELAELLEDDVFGKVQSITVQLKNQSVKELLSEETRYRINELWKIISGSKQYKSNTKDAETLVRKMVEVLDSMESDLAKHRHDFKATLKALSELLGDDLSSDVKKAVAWLIWLNKQPTTMLIDIKTRKRINELRKIITKNEKYKTKATASKRLIKEMVKVLDNMKSDLNKRRKELKDTIILLDELLDYIIRSRLFLLKSADTIVDKLLIKQKKITSVQNRTEADKLFDGLKEALEQDDRIKELWMGDELDKEKVMSFFDLPLELQQYLLTLYDPELLINPMLKRIAKEIKNEAKAEKLEKGQKITAKLALQILNNALNEYNSKKCPISDVDAELLINL